MSEDHAMELLQHAIHSSDALDQAATRCAALIATTPPPPLQEQLQELQDLARAYKARVEQYTDQVFTAASKQLPIATPPDSS